MRQAIRTIPEFLSSFLRGSSASADLISVPGQFRLPRIAPNVALCDEDVILDRRHRLVACQAGPKHISFEVSGNDREVIVMRGVSHRRTHPSVEYRPHDVLAKRDALPFLLALSFGKLRTSGWDVVGRPMQDR